MGIEYRKLTDKIRVYHKNAGILKLVDDEEIYDRTIDGIAEAVLGVAQQLDDTVLSVMGEITIDFVGGEALDAGTVYRAIDEAYAMENRLA